MSDLPAIPDTTDARDLAVAMRERLRKMELPKDKHALEHWQIAGEILAKLGADIKERVKDAVLRGQRPVPRNYSLVDGPSRTIVNDVGGLFDVMHAELEISPEVFLRTACNVSISGVHSLFISHSPRDPIDERKAHAREVLERFSTKRESAKQLKPCGQARRDNQPDDVLEV